MNAILELAPFRRTESSECCTVSQNCMRPPGLGRKVRSTCYACGQASCVDCSVKVEYYKFGRQRICHLCLPDHFKNSEAMIVAHLLGEKVPAGVYITYPRA